MTEEFQQAVAEVQAAANHACQKGRFLFAVYHIDQNAETNAPEIRMTRITHDFPRTDLEETVRMLERDVRQEIGATPAQPMQPGQPQAPMINLFGGDAPQPAPSAQPRPVQPQQPASAAPQQSPSNEQQQVPRTQSILINPPSGESNQ